MADTKSPGPETLFVTDVGSCSYGPKSNCAGVLAVENPYNQPIGESAKVSIYIGAKLVKNVTIPKEMAKYSYWIVSTVDLSTGEMWEGYHDPKDCPESSAFKVQYYKTDDFSGEPYKVECTKLFPFHLH